MRRQPIFVCPKLLLGTGPTWPLSLAVNYALPPLVN